MGAAVGGGVYSAVLMSTGSTTAAGFASSFAEAATNEILSYIPKVSSVNGTSETQVLTGENVLTSIADVMTDGITNGILLSATGKIVSSSKFLPEVPLPATDTLANAVWSEAALTSIGQTIAQGGLMVGISLGGAIGNALYGRKQDALYVLYPE